METTQHALHGASLLRLSKRARAPSAGATRRSDAIIDGRGGAVAPRGRGAHGSERLAKRLQLLLEALPAGVVVLDASGYVEECNPAAESILSARLERARWRDIVARVFSPRNDDACDVSLANGRRVNITTCALGDEPGQILLISDVTQTRELQSKLAGVERLCEMGAMMASLAHQIRTPLSSALLHASNLKSRNGCADRVRDSAGKITAQLQHLDRLVNDMLQFARNGDLAVDAIEVRELIAALRSCMSPDTGVTRVRFDIDGVPDCRILGNLQALRSVFENLVINALQAGGQHVMLGLSAGMTPSGALRVVLTDDGPGVSAALEARIFQPFVTTRADGVGLGLAIARRIIEAHGGELTLESTPGTGCTFTMTLPVASGAAPLGPETGRTRQ